MLGKKLTNLSTNQFNSYTITVVEEWGIDYGVMSFMTDGPMEVVNRKLLGRKE